MIPSPRLRAGIVLGVFVAAFLERWWFSSAWGEAGSLTSAFYYGDAQRLVENALAIVQGRVFDNGIPYHPPGWPIVLAALLKLVGSGSPTSTVVPVAAVKALLAAMSAGTVAVTTMIAFEVSGFGAMLAVAILGSFHFGHIVEGTVADTEALYGLCVAIAVLATLRASSVSGRRSLAWTAMAGAFGGYAMIVRAEFLACALVLAGCITLAASFHPEDATLRFVGGVRRRQFTHIAVFFLCYALVLVPTTLWHWRTIGAFNRNHVGRVAGPLPRFAPVTSYGPFNFAMANHENADGGPNRDHPMLDLCNAESSEQLDVGQLDLACPAVYDLYVKGYRIGAAWLLEHPANGIELVWHKLTMTAGFLAQGYLIDDIGAGVTGTRRRVDLVDPDSRWLLPVHLALAIAGFWMLRRNRLGLAIVAAPLVALLASTVLFYGYVRLGTSYLPAVWILQGTGLSAMFLPDSGRADRHAAIVSAIIVTLLAIQGFGPPRHVTLDGPRTDSGVLMQDETVRVEH